MKLYLMGPMAGLPDFNFPAFNKKAAELRALGHHVFNPAEVEPEMYAKIASEAKKADFHNSGYRNTLGNELKWICENAEGVYALRNWEHSYGAGAEFAAAKAVRAKFFYESEM